MCAALKNTYALAVGLAEGVRATRGGSDRPDRMHNYEAALFAQGAAEMRQIVALLGGNPDTAGWLPGIGDLYVTSIGGRNVRLGRLLGAGASYEQASERLGHPTLEGAAAIRVIGQALSERARHGTVNPEAFPLLRHLYEIIALDRPVEIPWGAFFGGQPGRHQTTAHAPDMRDRA